MQKPIEATILAVLGVTCTLLMVGCGECDNHVGLSVQPSTLKRATPTTVSIRLDKPVVPPTTDDLRIMLYEPSGYSIADFIFGADRYQIISDVRVVDQNTVAVDVQVPAKGMTGTYQWSFSYNDGGECDVAYGDVTIRVD